jgi:hypothetical protein
MALSTARRMINEVLEPDHHPTTRGCWGLNPPVARPSTVCGGSATLGQPHPTFFDFRMSYFRAAAAAIEITFWLHGRLLSLTAGTRPISSPPEVLPLPNTREALLSLFPCNWSDITGRSIHGQITTNWGPGPRLEDLLADPLRHATVKGLMLSRLVQRPRRLFSAASAFGSAAIAHRYDGRLQPWPDYRG